MSKTTNKFSPEVRAGAVRMILDHEGDYPSRWSAVVSVVAYKLVDIVIGLRVPEEEEREGLDLTSHGESAYHH